MRGGLKGLPDDDLAADLFELTQEMTDRVGLPAYEISNHASPDDRVVHNQIYWKSGDWVGIGPGAHGRLTLGEMRVATRTYLDPLIWLSHVSTNETGECERDTLTKEDIQNEQLMMGLRLSEGIALSSIDENFDFKIRELEKIGLLKLIGGQLSATKRGRSVLNYVLRELLA